MIESKEPIHDSRVMREARILGEAGHEVSILAWDRTGRSNTAADHSGVRIERIPTTGLMGALRTDLLRIPIWWRHAYRLARRMSFDAVHCHDLDALPIGVRLKRSLGRPLIYDCHEVFGYMIEEDVPRIVSNYVFRMERKLAPQSDYVVTVTDSVKAYLDAITGKEALVVRNCADLQGDEYVPPAKGPFTLLYIGDLHPSRFVIPAIETVGETAGVRLVIGGTKRLTPVVRAKCAEYPNTEFLGPVPVNRVFDKTLGSHAVLAMLDPAHRAYHVAISTKVFEAMAAGRPSITTKGLPGGELVERERCGLSIPYERRTLREAIERLRDDPNLAERLGRQGLEAAKREYNWRSEGRKLVDLYQTIGAK